MEGSVADTLIAGPQVHTVSTSTAGVGLAPGRLHASQLVRVVIREAFGQDRCGVDHQVFHTSNEVCLTQGILQEVPRCATYVRLGERFGGRGGSVRTTVHNLAHVSFAAVAFYDQNQTSVINKNMNVPPISITHRAMEDHLQLENSRKKFCTKNLVCNLKEQMIAVIASEKEQGVGNCCSEAQLQVKTSMAVVLGVPPAPIRLNDVQVNESWS